MPLNADDLRRAANRFGSAVGIDFTGDRARDEQNAAAWALYGKQMEAHSLLTKRKADLESSLYDQLVADYNQMVAKNDYSGLDSLLGKLQSGFEAQTKAREQTTALQKRTSQYTSQLLGGQRFEQLLTKEQLNLAPATQTQKKKQSLLTAESLTATNAPKVG